jgi:hypothetical protein
MQLTRVRVQIQKDTLQSTLISDASRKRRRVERERRAIADPLRRTLDLLPEPPRQPREGEQGREYRPSVRAIVSVALRHPYARFPTVSSADSKGKSTSGAISKSQPSQSPAVSSNMPTLSQLNKMEIDNDLELLNGYRRGYGDVAMTPINGIAPNSVANAGNSNSMSTAPPLMNGVQPGISSPSGMGGPPVQDYSRNPYEPDPREMVPYNEHHPHQSMMNQTSSKSATSGRERDRDAGRDRSSTIKKYPSSASLGTHPNGQQPVSNQSHPYSYPSTHGPRLGGASELGGYSPPPQSAQRLPDPAGAIGLQNMPLPPAPSTIPASGKHHLNTTLTGSLSMSSGSGSHGQHPSLAWESGKREREREDNGGRERSHSGAGRTAASNAAGVPYASSTPPLMTGGSGRSHSHSVSHTHTHYHPTHTHSRSHTHVTHPAGGHSHSHAHVPHHHSHAHPHPHSSSSHLHVIHNHGPASSANPSGSLPQPSSSSSRPGSSAKHMGEYDKMGRPDSSNTWKDRPYEDDPRAHRSQSSYSAPMNTMDRERDRDRASGGMTGMNVLHPSLSQGQERHPAYVISHPSQMSDGRDQWNERDRERDRDRHRGREERDRYGGKERDRYSSGMSMPPLRDQPGDMEGVRDVRPSGSSGNAQQGPSMSSYGSKYPYPSSAMGSIPSYSPPGMQAPLSRRNTPPPPPLLPPVPNTSSRYGSNPASRRSPPVDPDIIPVGGGSSNMPSEVTAHSPTSSLNPSGYNNPWSAGPRSTARQHRPSSPTILPGPTSSKINPPLQSMNGLPQPTSTLSPILARPNSSMAPRPPISPAPRPTSAHSIHAILGPTSEITKSPQSHSHSQPSTPYPGMQRDASRGDAAQMDVDPAPTGA